MLRMGEVNEVDHQAIQHMLPRKQLTAEELADIIHKRHQRRLSAKKSSARRNVALE